MNHVLTLTGASFGIDAADQSTIRASAGDGGLLLRVQGTVGDVVKRVLGGVRQDHVVPESASSPIGAHDAASNASAVDSALVRDPLQGEDPTHDACHRAATQIAEGLDRPHVVPAFVSPSPSGGLGFYWHGGRAGVLNVSLEIELENDELDLFIQVADANANALEARGVETIEEALASLLFWLAGEETGTLRYRPHSPAVSTENHRSADGSSSA